jgi:hypothetical protein
MARLRATTSVVIMGPPFGLGTCLAALLIGIAVLLSPALLAQEQTSPQVVYAVAPDWPTTGHTRTERPRKEVVLVKVTVDGFGNVVGTQSLSRKSVYSESAVRAAKLWKFGPPTAGVEPAELKGMSATLNFTFQLLSRDTSPDELGTAFIPPYEICISRLVAKR